MPSGPRKPSALATGPQLETFALPPSREFLTGRCTLRVRRLAAAAQAAPTKAPITWADVSTTNPEPSESANSVFPVTIS